MTSPSLPRKSGASLKILSGRVPLPIVPRAPVFSPALPLPFLSLVFTNRSFCGRESWLLITAILVPQRWHKHGGRILYLVIFWKLYFFRELSSEEFYRPENFCRFFFCLFLFFFTYFYSFNLFLNVAHANKPHFIMMTKTKNTGHSRKGL